MISYNQHPSRTPGILSRKNEINDPSIIQLELTYGIVLTNKVIWDHYKMEITVLLSLTKQ